MLKLRKKKLRVMASAAFAFVMLFIPVNGEDSIIKIGTEAVYSVFGKKASSTEACLVSRIVDGDTIELIYNGQKEKVRLIGVDTPESVHPDKTKNVPEGKIASDYVKERLLNETVNVEFDVEERDRYGRMLAYVYIDDVMINKELLDMGYAAVLTVPPNVKYSEEFLSAQKKARKMNRGFWGLDSEPLSDN